MKFNQFGKKLFFMTAAFCGLFLANSLDAFAQFTFIGDYDKTFAAPNGYYVEPQNNFPADATNPNRRTYLFTGDYAPDGSIIAGGRIERTGSGDFWLRKFTASGAVDTSFGGGTGYVRTIFYGTESMGSNSGSQPTVLKRQADGKIVFGGICAANAPGIPGFGSDICLVRYNADGTLDSSFGNTTVTVGGPAANNIYTFPVGAGRVITQTGIREDGTFYGAGLFAQLSDMAIQPDGKIVVAGYTRSEVSPYFQGVGQFRTEGIIIRYNANGTLDTTFGLNGSGIARFIPANTGTTSPCYPARAFYGVRLQADGRIIAVGHDGVSDPGCFQGQVFVVTRWNTNGTLETARRLDGNTNVFAREKGVAALITNDDGKLLVSGSYQGNLALTRFNLSDLTLDPSFGTNGIKIYSSTNTPLYIKAIQPDGKILAVDGATNYPVSRLNPNGSPDNSFGNRNFDGSSSRGRLDIPATSFNLTAQPVPGQLLLRPNGKFNLIGYAVADEGGNSPRSFVSQNINSFHSGINNDFTNDGKADIAVFRTGDWYYLNSADNQFSGVTFGQASDKPVPADFDGDGKSDIAVYRPSNGYWYILQSSNNQFRTVQFGAGEDLPRPGDFDGDGYGDIAVFRPSTGSWFYLRSSDNQFRGIRFGQSGDLPLLGDFDGDGKSDMAVFRTGNWYYLQSSDNQFRAVAFGFGSDFPTVGDYDADGKSDVSVFRASNGYWYRLNSSTGAFVAVQFGQNGDKPVAADFDNDGKTDLAIFRSGAWYGWRSGDNSLFGISFGATTDVPVPAAYLP